MFVLFSIAAAGIGPAPACTAPPRSHTRPPAAARPRERADELFSLRARRRVAAYLRVRLLEMREEGLERAAAAIEHRISVDELLAGER